MLGIPKKKPEPKIDELWYNAQVRRFHTVPLVGEQTVAAHSWGVAMIILRLHPDPTKALLAAALTHDLAESYVGDVPYTLREFDAKLKSSIDTIEKSLLKEEFGIEYGLTLEEQNWLACADMLELVLFCRHQCSMGNSYAAIPLKNGIDYLIQMKKPVEVDNELRRYTKELLGQLG